MIRERLAGRSLARERGHLRGCGFGRGHFGGKFVLGRRGLQFLQRQFKLIQQPRGALGPRAITVAVQLLDLQLQMSDQRLVIGCPGSGKAASSPRNPLPRSMTSAAFSASISSGRASSRRFHDADGITKSAICGDFFSAAQNIFYAYPALCGRQVCCGFLQSIASSK